MKFWRSIAKKLCDFLSHLLHCIPWYGCTMVCYVLLPYPQTMVIIHGIQWFDHGSTMIYHGAPHGNTMWYTMVLPHGRTMVYHGKLPWVFGHGNTMWYVVYHRTNEPWCATLLSWYIMVIPWYTTVYHMALPHGRTIMYYRKLPGVSGHDNTT